MSKAIIIALQNEGFAALLKLMNINIEYDFCQEAWKPAQQLSPKFTAIIVDSIEILKQKHLASKVGNRCLRIIW
jgi:hypothetical protein